MKIESNLFLLPGAFFLFIGIVYGALTHFEEMVGFPAILLTAGLALMVGIYFKMLERRHGVRPEDRDDAEIAELSGDQGLYAPWSWWPIVLAGGGAIGFLALAVGWWLMVPAAIVGTVGLVGWVMEFSTGRFAH
ncbi:cytochrome c oxidase subunit 4 [Demequina capsici]|uniref:Cytochrome c oxidase polypeptide 4 n=1 Tax=Demequina capsici TaxID=3075620 RepID=A0AA96FDY1_9MICO|nr:MULTISPECIES: cytochrome c oxidase subunit 4 [unclassified Demequina]WNM25674.1 cytochrome c oxidase subunit 4 [Demequina sp. OYTSA14]WNM28569.1 cytochrome c oxidase subunit 4 [Demequina sp. PMTSA13]